MSDYIPKRRRGAKREPVGVRELKTHAARIVRAVREEHASYVVTHRGTAVGVILPLDQGAGTAPAAGTQSDASWTTFLAAGRRLGRGFRTGQSGLRELAESRR